jgi:ATP-dependent RNA helicase RhlE
MNTLIKKMSKHLANALTENNILEPTVLQQKIISKINSGADLIIESEDNSGKTTALVLTTIHKLKEPFEDAARALIIVPSIDHAIEMENQFKLLSVGTKLRIHTAHEGGKIDKQNEDIYIGADVVIGTPKRIMEIYFRKNINITKVKLFAIDDTELVVKNLHQGYIHRLADSLPKCQHLIFTNVYSERIEAMIEKFMVAPQFIESQNK